MADTFLGQSITDMVNQTDARYFYGLRRTDDGELFVAKVDQLKSNDSVQLNVEGDQDQNFEDFDQGQDFFEGRNVNHEKVFANLNYEQFRWDNRNINYYIDDSGNLVARINEGFTYPTGV
tara:strand:- start:5921 stop:6280 length:360 start_codon:yes stop_codon:yes gene_type:complete